MKSRVNDISHLKGSSVNVITFDLAQSDLIKLLILLFIKMKETFKLKKDKKS